MEGVIKFSLYPKKSALKFKLLAKKKCLHGECKNWYNSTLSSCGSNIKSCPSVEAKKTLTKVFYARSFGQTDIYNDGLSWTGTRHAIAISDAGEER